MRGQAAARCRDLACLWAWLLWSCLLASSSLASAKPETRNTSQIADSVAMARVTQLIKAAQLANQQNALSLSYQLLEEAYRLRADLETLYLLGQLAYICLLYTSRCV